MTYTNCERIYQEAHEAGMKAAGNHTPTPMVVEQHSNMMNDNSPVVKSWVVSGGVCGFAWINIKPANSKFAKWLKANNIVQNRSYYGGYDIWVSHFGQSMELKEKYAHAFANILNSYGIKAYSMSRMD